MPICAFYVLLIIIPSFAFGEGGHGRNPPPPRRPLARAESLEKVDVLASLGWSAIQARLRDDHSKGVELAPEAAEALYDLVEKNLSSDALSTLSLVFELYPSVASDLLVRKSPNRAIFDCAFLTWLRTSKPSPGHQAVADMLRVLMSARNADEPSLQELIRAAFRGPRNGSSETEESERLRKLRILSIAFAYHPDQIPTGISKADLTGILTNAVQDPRQDPGHQFVASESARAFRRLLVPGKDTSVAKMAEAFAVSRWDGQKVNDETPTNRTLDAGRLELTSGTRWIAVQYNPPEWLRCEYGCLTKEPILIESDSKFALFGLIPSSDPNASPQVRFSILRPGGRKLPNGLPSNAVVTKMENLPAAGALIKPPSNNVGGVSVLPVTHGLNVPRISGGIFDLGSAPPPQKFKRWKILTDDEKERMRFSTVVMSKDPPPEVELTFPVLTYVRTFDEALRPSGILAERGRHEPIEVSGYRSLARLQMLFENANRQEGSGDTVTAARSAFLRLALPVAALELSQRYVPDLEQQALQLSATLGKVREAHRLIATGRKSFSELSSESAFALLGYAADSLSIDKPNVVNDKKQLENALTGAEEQLRNLVLELSERKNFVCELLKRFEFPGTGLLPAMTIDENVNKVCAEK